MPIDDKKLDSILSKVKREAEERDAERVGAKNGLQYLNLATKPIETDALELMTEEIAKEAKIALIEKKGNQIVAVVLNPEDEKTKNEIKKLIDKGFKVRIFIVSQSSLNRAWEFYKYLIAKTASLTGRIDIDKNRMVALMQKLNTLEKVAKEVEGFDFRTLPTSHILEIVLAGALAARASDVHFEPSEHAVRIRYRIDGDLNDVMSDLSTAIYNHLVSRIKLLSNLKINVRDEAQDGRFTIGLGNKDVELRVALAPSEYGEVVVMRILDPDAINLNLNDLGLRKDDLEIIKSELDRPNGMILNTGPTGSGKTTTLYAFLKHKYSPEIKIITIEDPIEYHLEGIEQTQVDEDAKYDFANGLRSLMRQDPDVILIGEIRDGETAGIAIQSALTGHLVFSTIHANGAAGAIPRLIDLGVKPTSIGPSLNLIIAQRLVRRLCEKCKAKENVAEEQKEKIEKLLKGLPARVNKNDFKEINIYKSVGCEHCGGTGYRGRVGIYELLGITKEIEDLLNKSAGEIEIQQFALKQGMVTMQQDGILKVISGISTFIEVEKITGPIEY